MFSLAFIDGNYNQVLKLDLLLLVASDQLVIYLLLIPDEEDGSK